MKSYLNNPKLKTATIEKLKTSIAKNILVQEKLELGFYEHWEEGKGSVLGCISELNEIEEIAKMFGFPEQLLEIQDHIFQFLDKEEAQQFGVDFLEAIAVGVDLKSVWIKYFIWLLVEVDSSTMDALGHIPLAKTTIELAVETLKELLIKDIPHETLEKGVILNLNAYRRSVGQAADAGAIEPEYAGWELAKAHSAVNAYTNSRFVNMVLPQAGHRQMWNFLAKQLIELIKKGTITKNTFEE
jgi:hypothetical protein